MRFPVSKFQKKLEAQLIESEEGRIREVLTCLIESEELNHLQEYANIVSINRLGFNDHGPVHARMVAKNALELMHLIQNKIPTSLEVEKLGSFEDSIIVLLISAFCHDLGMTMGRHHHERNSIIISEKYIEEILRKFYKDSHYALILKTLVFECIIGHMGMFDVSSIEAGVLLVSDGCDMTKGRARIPYSMQTRPTVGDIHKYSAMSINQVHIQPGDEKYPIKITVDMDDKAGIFQIEQVLYPKVIKSSIKKNIQIIARLKNGTELPYQ
ncbi:MAG TPA: HD domain-containing protein [Firmicutes bacterium]|nr:HD domain-containing protein [Bacillota bacterium]